MAVPTSVLHLPKYLGSKFTKWFATAASATKSACQN